MRWPAISCGISSFIVAFRGKMSRRSKGGPSTRCSEASSVAVEAGSPGMAKARSPAAAAMREASTKQGSEGPAATTATGPRRGIPERGRSRTAAADARAAREPPLRMHRRTKVRAFRTALFREQPPIRPACSARPTPAGAAAWARITTRRSSRATRRTIARRTGWPAARPCSNTVFNEKSLTAVRTDRPAGETPWVHFLSSCW